MKRNQSFQCVLLLSILLGCQENSPNGNSEALGQRPTSGNTPELNSAPETSLTADSQTEQNSASSKDKANETSAMTLLDVPFDFRAVGIPQPKSGGFLKIEPDGHFSVYQPGAMKPDAPPSASKPIDFARARVPVPPKGAFVQVYEHGIWMIVDNHWQLLRQYDGSIRDEDVDPLVRVGDQIAPDPPTGGWVTVSPKGEFRVYGADGKPLAKQPEPTPATRYVFGVQVPSEKLPKSGEARLMPPRYVDQRRENDPREALRREAEQRKVAIQTQRPGQRRTFDRSGRMGIQRPSGGGGNGAFGVGSKGIEYGGGGGGLASPDPNEYKKTPAMIAREQQALQALRAMAAAKEKKQKEEAEASAAKAKKQQQLDDKARKIVDLVKRKRDQLIFVQGSEADPSDRSKKGVRWIGRLLDAETLKPVEAFELPRAMGRHHVPGIDDRLLLEASVFDVPIGPPANPFGLRRHLFDNKASDPTGIDFGVAGGRLMHTIDARIHTIIDPKLQTYVASDRQRVLQNDGDQLWRGTIDWRTGRIVDRQVIKLQTPIGRVFPRHWSVNRVFVNTSQTDPDTPLTIIDLTDGSVLQRSELGADSPLAQHLDGQHSWTDFESVSPDGRMLVQFGHNAIVIHDLATGDFRVVAAYASFSQQGDPDAELDHSLDLFDRGGNVAGRDAAWLDNRRVVLATDTAEIAVLDVAAATLEVFDAGCGRYDGSVLTTDRWVTGNGPGPEFQVTGLRRTGDKLVFFNGLAMKDANVPFAWPVDRDDRDGPTRGAMFQLDLETRQLTRLEDSAAKALWINDNRYLYLKENEGPTRYENRYSLWVHDVPRKKSLPLLSAIEDLPVESHQIGSRLLFATKVSSGRKWWTSHPAGKPAVTVSQLTGMNVVGLQTFGPPVSLGCEPDAKSPWESSDLQPVFTRPKRDADDWPVRTTDWMEIARLLNGKSKDVRLGVWYAIDEALRERSAIIDPVAYAKKLISAADASEEGTRYDARWYRNLLASDVTANERSSFKKRLDPKLLDSKRLNRFVYQYVAKRKGVSPEQIEVFEKQIQAMEEQLKPFAKIRARVAKMDQEQIRRVRDRSVIEIWNADQQVRTIKAAIATAQKMDQQSGRQAFAKKASKQLISEFDEHFSVQTATDRGVMSWIENNQPTMSKLLRR